MDVYEHIPLKADLSEIRVMTLLPGDFESPIIVSLSKTALADMSTLTPSLEALSYTWGPLNKRRDIIVKGNNNETLSITENLAQALKYLRHDTESRLLWIDAICINQLDLEERGRQVRLMAKIYSRARRVLLWVGPKSEDSDLAMDYISIIASRIKVNWETTQLYPITDESHWADHDVPLPLSDIEYAALFRFYCRSWFKRLWVWQEVHLAADALLLCGDRSIRWEDVRSGVLCMGLKPRPGTVEWPAPEAAFSMCVVVVEENQPLISLLHKTKEAICSDPRDRIYALLSFLDQAIRSRIIPNYNMSAQEVYQDAVLQHFEIGHRDGPRLLSTVEIQKDIPNRPSWVPRWDIPRATTRLYHSKAALATLPSIGHLSAATIEALGVYITKVSKVEQINISDDASQQAILNELRKLKEHVLPQHGQKHLSHSLFPFLETLTANYVAERHHPPYAWRPSTEDFQPFLDIVFEDQGVNDLLIDRILRNIREFGRGRALCITTDRKLCLSPLGTRPGDIVIVILGCDSPMILRPTTPDCLQYWVVGEAFCHGIMDGEALLGPLPEHWQIVIRHDTPGNHDCTAFWNSKSRQFSAEDPRLGDLSDGWRRKSHAKEEFQPLFVQDSNGECLETWEDPRIATNELRLRGVQLETFKLA
jgi:hypothetical protein